MASGPAKGAVGLLYLGTPDADQTVEGSPDLVVRVRGASIQRPLRVVPISRGRSDFRHSLDASRPATSFGILRDLARVGCVPSASRAVIRDGRGHGPALVVALAAIPSVRHGGSSKTLERAVCLKQCPATALFDDLRARRNDDFPISRIRHHPQVSPPPVLLIRAVEDNEADRTAGKRRSSRIDRAGMMNATMSLKPSEGELLGI